MRKLPIEQTSEATARPQVRVGGVIGWDGLGGGGGMAGGLSTKPPDGAPPGGAPTAPSAAAGVVGTINGFRQPGHWIWVPA